MSDRESLSATVPLSTAERLETHIGVVIAIFAAILAINGLGAGHFGDDEQQAIIERSNQYNWYQSKSIKRGLADNQADLLESLKAAGLVDEHHQQILNEVIDKLHAKSLRYERETQVILTGSVASSKQPWFDELDQDMRHVTGASEFHQKALELGQAGDWFDFAELFLQISVVFGAICLVIKRLSLKYAFYRIMLALGSFGTLIMLGGFWIAFHHL